MPRHPLGTRARVLLTSVFGPYAQDDEFGSRAINPMELYQNQVTREQGPFSLRMFHRSWGIILIQHNISAASTLLDFPTRARFVRELTRTSYDIVGISGIIANLGKVRAMCRLVREHAPHATIVVGGHVTAVPGIEHVVDADHFVKGEGVAWFREFLGEDPERPVAHPALPSAFGFRIMGLPSAGGGATTAATVIPSVGCPLACNFCTTSAFFGGRGKFVRFLERGQDIFRVMAHAEATLGASSFFVMDENFLLDRPRALELLDCMKRGGKAWSLYVFSSANAIAKYTIRELVELGVAWVWMGLESAQSQYTKLKGSDTRALTAELQAHGIRVLGSTIIGLEHHTPENIGAEIEHAVAHDTDFHQFMLYTPVPGTELYRQMEAEGRLTGLDYADSHGQYQFNFQHAAIGAAESKHWLDRAFQLDFERNGPSLYRLMRTMFQGWRRYRDDADARIRERVARDASLFRFGYGAALFAMERYFRDTNGAVSHRVRALRHEVEREFGAACRAVNVAVGPVALWSARREGRQHPAGRRLEPRTFVERRAAMPA